MEFTPSPSSIFQNKKIKYNNKKPTKNGIIWINFSKIRKARCTLTPLSLRSARLTQYMRFARCTSLSHILLRFTTQNIAYPETLYKIILITHCDDFSFALKKLFFIVEVVLLLPLISWKKSFFSDYVLVLYLSLVVPYHSKIE